MWSYSSHTCFGFISSSLSACSGATFRFFSAGNPTNQGERQLMLDRQSNPLRLLVARR
jgi:hypothetical protein